MKHYIMRLIFPVVLVALPFTGCGTLGMHKPSLKSAAPSEPKGPFVERLTGGQEGFVVTEVPRLAKAARQDFERAVDLIDAADYEGAIALLEPLAAQSPMVTAPYINLAIAYAHMGRPEKAEPHLKTALTLMPAHPVASNAYGLLHRKAGRFTEARQVYEASLGQFPEYYPLHRNLGILCDLYLNDPDCALAHYQIYNRAIPQDEPVKMWIADLKHRMGTP
ncbi:MAG: tetratricopeptide repeat protein [Desulfatitalea sp.]|nr:tetratricopeptide repeat protein [Desulfatitalea sp.]NNK02190.1 tetratricopeptide repeat protein [Desulfatitalea sp.]